MSVGPFGAAGLVGRDDVMSGLDDLLERTTTAGGAVAVLGEAGIGKSSVLGEAMARARARGFLVLDATGVETETLLPYAGLHQLLRPVSDSFDVLAPGQRLALGAAFGEHDGPAPEPFLIALAALNVLSEVSSTTSVLVAVDDVQWLDPASQEALTFLARRVDHDAVAVIGVLRAGHSSPFLQANLPQMEVTGLDDPSARLLLDRVAGDLALTDRERILREAVGNPLALVELPAALGSFSRDPADLSPSHLPLTSRLERAFAHRIGTLPATTRDLLLVAAVDSVDEVAEMLAAASVLAGAPLDLGEIDPAVAARLVHVDGMRLRFRHPLVRSAILQSETVVRVRDTHAALAEVLVNEPYRRTWHRAQALVGPDDQVADELEASHVISIQRGAMEPAIWALERAAQLTTDPATRGRRLLLAAEHAFGLGRADMVDRLLASAGRSQLTDLDLARMEWLREIFNDGVPGDATRVFELCATAEDSVAHGDAGLGLNLLLGAALRGWWADTGETARSRIVAIAHRIRDVEDDPRFVATLAVAEPIREGAEVTDLLKQLPVESVGDADALRLLGMASHAIGDMPRAMDYFIRAEARLREQGRVGLLPHVRTMQLQGHMAMGDWEAATAAAEEGTRLALETGQPIWSTGTLVSSAMLAGLLGDAEGAFAMAAEAEQASNRQRLNDLLACVGLARAYAWISTGNMTEALDELVVLFDPTNPGFHPRERFLAVMYLAEAAAHVGDVERARGILAEMEEVGRLTPSPVLHVQLSYARAVLAPDDTEAEHQFRAALGQDLTRWPWPRARIELAYGLWLRRQRRVSEARAPLRSALTTLDLIGATRWADQARGELRASGERSTERGAPAREVLSAQELQIARLAAEGLSNREIAERLFLSHRTVGSHLYRIFPKLDIGSRGQLAQRLDLT